MKRTLILILILILVLSQSAFAVDINPIVLSENDFSLFSEGDFDFSEVTNIEGGTGESDKIYVRDLEKSLSSDEDLPKGFSYDSSNFGELDISSLTGYSLDSDGNLLMTMQSERGSGSKLNLGGEGLKGNKIRFKIIFHNHSANGGAEYYLDNSFVRGGGFFDIYKQKGRMGTLQMSSRVISANNILFEVGYESTIYYNTLVIDMDTTTGNATYALWHCTTLDDALSRFDTSGADTKNLKTSGTGTSQSGQGAALGDIILSNSPSAKGDSTDITIYSISLENLSTDDEDETNLRGNSLVMQKGNFENGYNTAGGATYLSFMAGKKNDDGTYASCDSEILYEFDFLWSGGFTAPERIVMRLMGEKNGEPVEDQAINVTDGYFEFNKYTSGQQAVRYTKKVWYKAKYRINLINDTYTFELFNDDGSLKGMASGNLVTSLDSLSELRFSYITSVMNDVGIEKYFAFDNVKITYNDILPKISKIMYQNESGQYIEAHETLPNGLTKLRLFVDAPIQIDGEMKDALEIYAGGIEEEPILENAKECKYIKSQNHIDVELDSPLKSGADYVFTFNSSTRTPYGDELFGDVSKTLRVDYNPVDVTSCEFETNDGSLTAKLDFVNSTEAERDVVVILAVYDGNCIKSLSVYDKKIAVGNDDFETSAVLSDGETMEVYVWDSVYNAESITEKLFVYKY